MREVNRLDAAINNFDTVSKFIEYQQRRDSVKDRVTLVEVCTLGYKLTAHDIREFTAALRKLENISTSVETQIYNEYFNFIQTDAEDHSFTVRFEGKGQHKIKLFR